MNRIVVIGGGPAGLMAAGQAALKGAKVTLIEKKDNPARKLRLTGNGRCNLTNMAPLDEFLEHFGRNGKFLRPAFSQFFASELRSFFENLGVRLIKDERGRVYPKSNDANDIADTLLDWAIKCGVKILARSQVTNIEFADNHVSGIRLAGKDAVMTADAIIVATGGASYPSTGSSGDGYRLAKLAGHTIVQIRPASVPLKTVSNIISNLQGISINNVAIRLKSDKKVIAIAIGDLIFTHYGVSGPAILSLSRICVDQLRAGIQPILLIDILPEHNETQLEQIILRHFEENGKRQVQTIIKYLIPQKMAPLFLSDINIDPTKLCNQVTSDERNKIVQHLKCFEIKVTGHRSFAEAMVTAGGVSLKEINPQTMESRLIKGLYFAGEVLDLDADTGGFNLQAAFSTGWLAGKMCLQETIV